MKTITIKTPFDRHVHLRELITLLRFVLPYTARQFFGMVVMPNLKVPITTWQMAELYRNEILMVAKEQNLPNFTPVMTAYLTDSTNPDNIEEGFKNGIWKAAKLYPHGATTNSALGVTELEKIFPVLERMQKIGMPLLVHPETNAKRYEIPFVDRERKYTEEALVLINKQFPGLGMSVEHITTIEAAQFVESCLDNVVGTITPQHLLYTTDAIFHGGVFPFQPGAYVDNMCLPILKSQKDVDYLRKAITYGPAKDKFGAGTDTAPHTVESKQAPGSCCGCFTALTAVELYTMVFNDMVMLDSLEGKNTFENFMSVNNLHIYGLEPSKETITIEEREQTIPKLAEGNIRPFKADQIIPWTMIPRTS